MTVILVANSVVTNTLSKEELKRREEYLTHLTKDLSDAKLIRDLREFVMSPNAQLKTGEEMSPDWEEMW